MKNKPEILKSMILVSILMLVLVFNTYSITYAKYTFSYTIDTAKIEVIV